MKQRYTYSLLFGIPGIIISAFAAMLAGVLAFAFLWGFVFGDNTWPAGAGLIILGTQAIAFLVTLTIMVVTGYFVGKKRELEYSFVNSGHVIISVAILILSGAIMFTLQRGYSIKRQNRQQCVNICLQNGYEENGTYLSPNDNGDMMCNCWNGTTNEYNEMGIIK